VQWSTLKPFSELRQKKDRWSPVLRNSAILRRYWKLRLREASSSGLNYTASFTRWQQQIQTYDPDFVLPCLGETLTLTVIREHFNRATRAFRRCQEDSVPLRMKCYLDLLDTYEDDMNPDTKGESQRKATIVRRTLDSETLRGTFRNIRRVVNPTETSGLTKLMIPRSPTAHTAEEDVYRLVQETDPNDLIWETIIDRADIERQLLLYNRNSFRAAAESPCERGLIHDAITFSSLSPASTSILAGEIPYEWSSNDQALREFLASFTVPDPVLNGPAIPTEISLEDICKGFQQWPESTSTSPSGRHLGHYKAIIQHPDLL
jgi:hypothetical protein